LSLNEADEVSARRADWLLAIHATVVKHQNREAERGSS